MEILTANVLLIGRSAAGKSSLLNYLFGQEIERTGAGGACTGRGIFEHSFMVHERFRLRVSDTWGLEPDKAEEWEELILQDIRRHDAGRIADWYHTILYCINLNTARIEEFERGILRRLTAEGNHILVVLTHADCAGAAETTAAFRTLLLQDGIPADSIVPVCSVVRKTIGGTGGNQFGRELLLDRIREGLWERIVERAPGSARAEAEVLIDRAEAACAAYAEKYITLFNMHSDRNYQKLNRICGEVLGRCLSDVQRCYEDRVTESVRFYLQLVNRGDPDGFSANTKERIEHAIPLNFRKNWEEKISENVRGILFSFVPGVNILFPRRLLQKNRARYVNRVRAVTRKMRASLPEAESRLRTSLEHLSV